MSWRPSLPRSPWARLRAGRTEQTPDRAPREVIPDAVPGEGDALVEDDVAAQETLPVDLEDTIAAAPADHQGPLHLRRPGDQRPLVAQPVIAMRARRHLRMITIGLLCAIVGALCVIGASMTLLRLTDASRLWPAAANAVAVICALIAFTQWRLWSLALREWEGIRDVGLANWMNVSASGVWISVLGALITPVALEQVVRDSTSAEPAWWLALAGGSLVILGVALAGAHRLRPRGPRGVPELIRRNNRRPAEQWAVLPAAAGPIEQHTEPGDEPPGRP